MKINSLGNEGMNHHFPPLAHETDLDSESPYDYVLKRRTSRISRFKITSFVPDPGFLDFYMTASTSLYGYKRNYSSSRLAPANLGAGRSFVDTVDFLNDASSGHAGILLIHGKTEREA